ncbi:GspH/FimT family pseudopilin [Pseudoalteromonas sp. T1lg65]|uniref:GspH/FimT family pseudopilin n=1 Tax=Pseudoalteromonas sp. T1lg65 TaxID=2077101 RepID=UPI003F79E5FF
MTVGNNNTKQAGFSLFELIVALAIVGILTFLATPSFMHQIKQDRVVNNANQISSFYKYARSEAVKQAKSIVLTASEDKWLLQAQRSGQLAVLHEFSTTHESIAINYPDIVVSSTGELNQNVNILITDNEDSTVDYRLCILLSGQSWIAEAGQGCV